MEIKDLQSQPIGRPILSLVPSLNFHTRNVYVGNLDMCKYSVWTKNEERDNISGKTLEFLRNPIF